MSVVPTSSIERAAARLLHAARTRTPCTPVRDLIGSTNLRAAYAVQARLTEERLASGSTAVGRKIGLTSPAVQEQLGVSQPDLGVLFDDMMIVDGTTVDVSTFLQPRVEAEIAFVLGDDLVSGPLDRSQIRGALDHAVAAIEICDSRVAAWDITFGDTVADNASAGAFVLGVAPRSLADFDPVAATMSMTIDGAEASTGSGAACLGDPLEAVAWLARNSRELGEPLRAGEIVLSGALGPMRPVAAGAHVTADITGLGTVSVRFGTTKEGDGS